MEHRFYFSFIRRAYIMFLILVATLILLLVSKILHNKVVAGYHHYLPCAVFFPFITRFSLQSSINCLLWCFFLLNVVMEINYI